MKPIKNALIKLRKIFIYDPIVTIFNILGFDIITRKELQNSLRASSYSDFKFDLLDEINFEIIFQDNILSVSKLLTKGNLNITSSKSGNMFDIDLTGASVQMLFSAMEKFSKQSGEKIYVYSTASGIWQRLSEINHISECSSGRIELAISCSGSFAQRFSVNIWIKNGNFIESTNRKAPIKKILLSENVLENFKNDKARSENSIDAVYTWVNASDENWQRMHFEYFNSQNFDKDRFDQSDELKFSIRSIDMFAPWIDNIYIFSNCEPPSWFKHSDRVKWIYHSDVIPNKYLPTFNSHAIETFLHQIPNLSNNFIYFNDDVFLNDFLNPEDFFTKYGKSISRLEPYGMMQYFGSLCESNEAEEWQHAAVNSSKILEKRFQISAHQLHQHSPHAYSKAIFAQMETEYPSEFEITRSSRVRTNEEYSLASFFYHHYALNIGAAVENGDNSMIVRHSNFKRFERNRMYKNLKFFCINDGGGSASDANFVKFKTSFLQKRYPFKSRAEQ